MKNVKAKMKIVIVTIGVVILIVISTMIIRSCGKTTASPSQTAHQNSGFTSDITKLFGKWRGNDGSVVFEFTQDTMRMFDHSSVPAFVDSISITQGKDELDRYIFKISAPDMTYTATIHIDGNREILTMKYGSETSQFMK